MKKYTTIYIVSLVFVLGSLAAASDDFAFDVSNQPVALTEEWVNVSGSVKGKRSRGIA